MEPVDTLVSARWVVPVEPDGRVLEDHALAIRNGRIVAVLPSADAFARYTAHEVLDRPTHVLMPGLVNAHTHAAMVLLRGRAENLLLGPWLHDGIWPLERRWGDPEYVRDGTELAIAEMLRGGNIMFEGAQGALLDVDVGTYPFVTSSNTIAGEAAVGTGLGPRDIHKVLGIVKAYTTRVGAGPFPTELFDETGEHLSRVGHEFGAVTGRARRCGWFDAIALRRAVLHNSISSLGVTKLDVLDGLDTLSICTGYRIDGEVHASPPLLPHRFSECEPVYEEHPGWKEATAGITDFGKLPANARKYLARLEELGGVPIDIVSTGPDRNETIVLRHPYD